MKNKNLVLLVVALFLMFSCDRNNDGYELVNVATPEFMSKDAFKSSVKILPPKSIDKSGKIYAYNHLVLVNDIDKGIHIIDNSHPENPVNITFIRIISNRDMEIKGNYLYADSLTDLLVFDISNLENILEMARLENVFSTYVSVPFMENLIYDYGDNVYNPDEIIVGWNISEEKRSIDDINRIRNSGGFIDTAQPMAMSQSTGQGGSLARFKIVNDYLYAVDSHSFSIFDISVLETPKELEDVQAGFDIETIFNKGDYLFLGSMSGMYIYDISSPETPKYISEFQHGTACDPVVVDDNYAYITLRAGNSCGAFESSLEIVDISDIYNPKRTSSYAMDNPYGLGIKDEKLFICDGSSGLKVYNKSNIQNLKMLNHFKNITTFDVIPLSNHLLMIGEEVLYQYNYKENSMELLSTFHLN